MRKVNERVDADFAEAYHGAQLKPIFRVEYKDDEGNWQELEDVIKASFNTRSNDDRKMVYTLVPPTSTLNLTLDNKDEQYSPGDYDPPHTYAGIIAIGRIVRLMVTYELE